MIEDAKAAADKIAREVSKNGLQHLEYVAHIFLVFVDNPSFTKR